MASPEDNSGLEVDQAVVEEKREEEADIGEEEEEELLEGVVEEENEEAGDGNDEMTDSSNAAAEEVEEEMAEAGDDNPVEEGGEVADQDVVEEEDEAVADDEGEEKAEDGDEVAEEGDEQEMEDGTAVEDEEAATADQDAVEEEDEAVADDEGEEKAEDGDEVAEEGDEQEMEDGAAVEDEEAVTADQDVVEEGDEAVADEEGDDSVAEGNKETAEDVDEGDDDIEDDDEVANTEKIVLRDEAGSHTVEQPVQFMRNKERGIVRSVVVYPVHQKDLKRPLIKAVLDMTKSFFIKFVSGRMLPKEGVLDMRFQTNELREKAYTMLSGLKLRGGREPRVETIETNRANYALVKRALEFLTKKNQEEEPAEPVSVFINNIPFDARVEMLYFLYPSARSVQLPVNSQGGAHGYAIVEFANLAEAQAVVRNNKEYPAGIGESYLNLHVIGHEEAKEQQEAKTSTEDPTNQREEASSKSTKESDSKAQKRPAQESSTVHQNGKCRKTDEKTGSEKLSGSEKTPEKKGASKKKNSGESKSASEGRILVPDVKDKNPKWYMLYIGNCVCTSARKLKAFLNNKMVSLGMCRPDESPVKKAHFDETRNYQFVEISTAKYALAAIKKLSGVEYMQRKIQIRGRKSMVAELTKELELELENSKSSSAAKKPPGQEVTRSSAARVAPPAPLYNVFVGNCPETTADELRDFLNEKMADAGICRPDDFPVRKIQHVKGRSYQFAKFCTATSAVAAMKVLNLVTFKKSILKIDEGRNSRPLNEMMEEEVNELLSRGVHRHDIDATIFVGNCPPAKMEDYVDFFTKLLRERGICQPDEHVIKRIKRRSDKNIDCQIIVFYEISYAIAAVEQLDGVKFKETKLTIKPANLVDVPGPTDGPVRDSRPIPDLLPGHIDRAGGNDSSAFDVYVGNLPDTTGKELEEFFRKEFVQRGLCHVNETPVKRIKFTGKRSFQFVVFRNVSAAITAISELNGAKFKGKQLTIKAGQNAPSVLQGPKVPKLMDLPLADGPVTHLPALVQKAASNYLAGMPGMSAQGVGMLPQGVGMLPPGVGMLPPGVGMLPPGVGMLPPGVGMTAQAAPGMDTLPRGGGGASHHPDKPEDSRAKGYDVFIGNLPKPNAISDKVELQNFIEYELVNRGIFRANERPILRMDFRMDRKYQFAVFRSREYVPAAVEALNGLVYKGFVIRVKGELKKGDKQSHQPMNEYREQFPPSTRPEYPPSTRSEYPPAARLEYPPFTRPEYPPSTRLEYPPPSTRLEYPEGTTLNYPPSTRQEYAPNTIPEYPPSTRLEFPPSTRTEYPQGTRLDYPPSTRPEYPTGTRPEYPPSTRPEYPPNTIPEYPPSTRLEFPPVTRTEYPPSTRTEYPPSTRLEFPPSTRLEFPPSTRLEFPPSTRLEYPEGTRLDYPPSTRQEYPPSTIPEYPPGTRLEYQPSTIPEYPTGTRPEYPPSNRLEYPPSTTSHEHRSQDVDRKVVPMEIDTAESFDILVGNVPQCEEFELKNFIMELLLNFGLCDPGDNPIKALDFTVGRRYQFVKFREESDAKAAVTVVDGREFKGKKLNIGMSSKKAG